MSIHADNLVHRCPQCGTWLWSKRPCGTCAVLTAPVQEASVMCQVAVHRLSTRRAHVDDCLAEAPSVPSVGSPCRTTDRGDLR